MIECHRLLVGEPHRDRLVTLREAFEFHLHNAKSQTKTTVLGVPKRIAAMNPKMKHGAKWWRQ